MLCWANQYNICCFLDSHQYADRFSTYDCLLAAGASAIFSLQAAILPQLKQFQYTHKDWLFGHISYSLKNEIEGLPPDAQNTIGFPTLQFFQPETVITVKGGIATIACLQQNPEDIFKAIVQCDTEVQVRHAAVQPQPRLSKEEYLRIIRRLQSHILRGDCYEINFCQEFFVENAAINPLQVYKQLAGISPTPFSAYYKLGDKYLLCASPERYIKRVGDTLYSQPMKGTIKRSLADTAIDDNLKSTLRNSEKDRSENVMVVDLVRNDLSRICTEGSVHVEELFGVHTYPQVHQMVSTIAGTLQSGIGLAEVLQATFPMGSMTGAPKKRVMELIEQYEPVPRGIFSGAVGYTAPNGDFDFNVVIRSIMYNATSRYLNYLVGSGITFYSDAESEYEECLLKAQAMQQVLR